MASFKAKLADGEARLTAHICTIPSATVTQAMVAAGADAVIIDLEHGAVDYGSAHAMIAATARSGCAALVRIAENEDWQVKRALDLGAEGICFPLIRTAEDAARAVASLRYPPSGARGFGPFLAHSFEGVSLMDYRATVDESRVCMLLIETREAVENIEEICKVPGIDILVPAFFDLSTAYGVSGQFDHPDVVAATARIEAAASEAGLPLGGPALSKAQADALFARGYRVIAGFDILFLKAAVAEAQGWTAG
ncbi:2,4-dihydroxyhept-2-ene-1,7-dioic acid aldolase [Alphaproteobacteria bacterium GH1-50]|uniref:2,4-dihydroxyhept-2-ene-1,7-dioic acid aldolase n=1 Tax=Kangsaoukella pontilimi TaxID=2691042 RepID=A0A7C9MWT5_9RHOB|nr:aldolase/citrate lyase family protein [Kangsaoukella pontilimi]MXQ08600.1 2,4-dihydroxyhept-2-ene-1,7-dioic acid aldolase [Kangsaoukella pontilimi]